MTKIDLVISKRNLIISLPSYFLESGEESRGLCGRKPSLGLSLECILVQLFFYSGYDVSFIVQMNINFSSLSICLIYLLLHFFPLIIALHLAFSFLFFDFFWYLFLLLKKFFLSLTLSVYFTV